MAPPRKVTWSTTSTASCSRPNRILGSACGRSCASAVCSGSRRAATPAIAAPAGVGEVEADVAGHACGASLPNPFAEAIVTGKARYTMDTAVDGLLHIKVLRSPHAHARIVSIDRAKTLAVAGVVEVFTWEDV